jgi:hypothetical protein
MQRPSLIAPDRFFEVLPDGLAMLLFGTAVFLFIGAVFAVSAAITVLMLRFWWRAIK